jgi:hypothetical protein
VYIGDGSRPWNNGYKYQVEHFKTPDTQL